MNKPLSSDQLRCLIPLNALSPRQLRTLRDQLVAQTVPAGELLFDEQTGACSSYFLLTGQLCLSGPGGVKTTLFAGSPQSFHALNPGIRLSQARAAEDSSVLIVNSDQLERLLAWSQNHADLRLDWLRSVSWTTGWKPCWRIR